MTFARTLPGDARRSIALAIATLLAPVTEWAQANAPGVEVWMITSTREKTAWYALVGDDDALVDRRIKEMLAAGGAVTKTKRTMTAAQVDALAPDLWLVW